ncbi:Ger(x)C family spore germination protein [Virgibacillus salexigens]|uniref:Spore germination protein A3 n=1 Tax=Virgibacillus massiliensis TaxID=1462526 RepID=A0A024QBV8_9BACI|nr:Ger(x)C family spore germination protein [Virgibacillus massiliensis]CDQ39998.1 Spore germination protein A3 precursor [Virgibacillus massiliensis]
MRKYHYFEFLLFILIILPFLSGCWDCVEIEDRGFVVGSAIDLVDKKSDGTYELMLTNQAVVPSGVGTPMESKGNQEAYMNISATGGSLFEITREMSSLTSQSLFFAHIKLLLLSEDVVKEPRLFENIMDVHLRDHEMRRNLRIVVVEGEARKALNIKPENEKIPALYIHSLMDNNYKNFGALKTMHIEDIHEKLLSEISYVVPELHIYNNKFLQYKGAVVFRGISNEMIDSLSEDETKGLEFMTEKDEGGAIEVEVDGQKLTVEISKINQTIQIKDENRENLSVEVAINIEGDVGERFGQAENVMDTSYLKKVEEATANRVKELAEKTIEKAQKDLKVDILGISDILYQRHYDLWNEIKDNWVRGGNSFTQSNIHVSTNAVIESVGSIRKDKATESE